MPKVDTESLKPIVRYMRAEADRALRGRVFAGIEIPADVDAGRNCSFWLHEHKGSDPMPVVFEIHGGGFALGDARKEDALCEWIKDSFGVHVVGLNYRLAPEHPAPAAVCDVVAAIRHVVAGKVCRVDPSRVYLLGYSAGACLALAACFALQRRSVWKPAGLVLHYPFLDAATPPVEGDSRAIDLPYEMMVAFNDWYVGARDARDPLVSPAFAADEQLARLPKTAIYPVVGDVLALQANRLRERMDALGCSVSWHPVEGTYHGYIEDAADIKAYRATSMPATLAARPGDFVNKAADALKASLEDALGPAIANVPFPGGLGDWDD